MLLLREPNRHTGLFKTSHAGLKEIRWNNLIILLLLSCSANLSYTSSVITNPNPNPNNPDTQETNGSGGFISNNDNVPISELSVPLFASHLSHHAYVYIGSPPQRRLVIVDTGSSILSFPCEPCGNCGTRHVSENYWDPKFSSTDVPNDCDLKQCVHRDILKSCKRNQCILKQAFSEGSSLIAYEISDLTWIGTDNFSQSIGLHIHTAVPFTFGCLLSERGIIATQSADGILGLAIHPENLITAMYKERSIHSNAFSLCLSRVPGGFLSIGGVQEWYHHLKEPLQFERLTSSSSSSHHYYTIKITSVHINSVTLSIPRLIEMFSTGKGTIIDSGTSDSYLPIAIAKTFQEGWIRERRHSIFG